MSYLRTRWTVLVAAALAAGAVPVEAAPKQVLERAEVKAAAVITPRVNEAIEAFAVTPPPPKPAANQRCRELAAQLIVRWEVTSPAYYDRRLSVPIWPRGASGVTWGIGYDGGHQIRPVIAADWADHAAVGRLTDTAGITGARAGAVLPRYADIQTPFPHAYRVFASRSLIEYERRAARAFDIDLGTSDPGVCAALVSLVYNRGAAMAGDNRREMRAIRDTCLPAHDAACIAAQLRSMCRLWRGTVNERGLCDRRGMEARYATGALP